jgi:hypothetical protein
MKRRIAFRQLRASALDDMDCAHGCGSIEAQLQSTTSSGVIIKPGNDTGKYSTDRGRNAPASRLKFMGVLLGAGVVGSLAVTSYDHRWSITETAPASAASKPAGSLNNLAATAAVPTGPDRRFGGAAIGDVSGIDSARECHREVGIDTACVFN